MHIFFCARAYSSEWGFFGHFARSAFRRTPNLTCRDSLFFSLSSCAVFIPSARGRWSSENGKLKSETRKATDKTQLAHRYAFFVLCSCLFLRVGTLRTHRSECVPSHSFRSRSGHVARRQLESNLKAMRKAIRTITFG